MSYLPLNLKFDVSQPWDQGCGTWTEVMFGPLKCFINVIKLHYFMITFCFKMCNNAVFIFINYHMTHFNINSKFHFRGLKMPVVAETVCYTHTWCGCALSKIDFCRCKVQGIKQYYIQAQGYCTIKVDTSNSWIKLLIGGPTVRWKN